MVETEYLRGLDVFVSVKELLSSSHGPRLPKTDPSRPVGVCTPALGAAVAVLVALLGAAEAKAAVPNVSGGRLLGASSVNVGGTLYDVQFVDGTCAALFAGCDEPADFPFTTSPDAAAAAQALLDQVFLDGAQGLFDTDPTLTEGCLGTTQECGASTPYEVSGSVVNHQIARNFAPGTNDDVLSGSSQVNGNFGAL
jgi:hypothetical protein